MVEDTQSRCPTNLDSVPLPDPVSEADFKVASKAVEEATSEGEGASSAMEASAVVEAVSATKAVAASVVGKASMVVVLLHLLTHRAVQAVAVGMAANRMGTMTVAEVGTVAVEVQAEVAATVVGNSVV